MATLTNVERMKSNYDAIIVGGGHNGLVSVSSFAQITLQIF